MATITEITLVDDLDGSNAEVTIRFSLDGAIYEIDLSAPNAERLREGIAEFQAAARRTGKPVPTVQRRPRRTSAEVQADQTTGNAEPATEDEGEPEPETSDDTGNGTAPVKAPIFLPAVAPQSTIREWARNQGISVNSRGALPRDLRAQFAEAHAG